jgi:hypothetical protein
MADGLDRGDWERILFALSHFLHNPAFQETYEKVTAILSPPGTD